MEDNSNGLIGKRHPAETWHDVGGVVVGWMIDGNEAEPEPDIMIVRVLEFDGEDFSNVHGLALRGTWNDFDCEDDEVNVGSNVRFTTNGLEQEEYGRAYLDQNAKTDQEDQSA